MSNYNLRPHHGLCLHFFRGKGYSEAFVQNMAAIQRTLAQNPTIRLVSGADDVCKACYHRVGQSDCATQEKVERYDAAVLAATGCYIGQTLSWADFYAKVQRMILAQNVLDTVCSDCEWYEICSALQKEETKIS